MTTPEVNAPAAAQPSAISKRAVFQALARLWWLPLLRGALLVALGGYALLTPGLTLVTYTLVLGVFVLADGLLALVAAALGWFESRGWMLARGLLGVVVGLLVVAHPAFIGLVTVMALVVLFGLQAVIAGGLEVWVAIRERNEIHGEWWLVLSGVLSIVFGGMLLAAPAIAAKAFIQILGIFAIVFGVSLIVLSIRLKGLGDRLPPEAE